MCIDKDLPCKGVMYGLNLKIQLFTLPLVGALSFGRNVIDQLGMELYSNNRVYYTK